MINRGVIELDKTFGMNYLTPDMIGMDMIGMDMIGMV